MDYKGYWIISGQVVYRFVYGFFFSKGLFQNKKMTAAHNRIPLLLIIGIGILFCLTKNCYSAQNLLGNDGITEHEAYQIIAEAYQEILQRYPDQEGLSTYLHSLVRDGKSEEWLRTVLLNSEEAQQQKMLQQRRKYIAASFAIVPLICIFAVFYFRKSFRDFLFNILLFFGYMCIACLFLEIALRATAKYQGRLSGGAHQNLKLSNIMQNNAVIHQRDMVQLSAIPSLIYEMRPNISGIFMGARVATGPGGYRITPGACDRSASSTILGLGDSFMFGQGVDDMETYFAHLARLMSNECNRFINMAVPGYNTVLKVEALEKKGMQYHPDLVIMHLTADDLELPDYIRKEDKTVIRTSSYLLDAVSRWMGTKKRIGSPDYLVRSPEKVPEQYAYMVGVAASRRELLRLKELGRKKSFQILVVTNGFPPDRGANIAAELNIPVLDIGKTLQRYMKEHDRKNQQDWMLTLSEGDPHFSPQAHTIIAEEIYYVIRRNNLLNEKYDDVSVKKFE